MIRLFALILVGLMGGCAPLQSLNLDKSEFNRFPVIDEEPEPFAYEFRRLRHELNSLDNIEELRLVISRIGNQSASRAVPPEVTCLSLTSTPCIVAVAQGRTQLMPMPRFRHARSAHPIWACRQKWVKGRRSARTPRLTAMIRSRGVISVTVCSSCGE